MRVKTGDRNTGARAVVVDDARRVLLLLRPQDEPLFGGYWNLPGGAVEAGEAWETAARRELREETGLTAEPSAIVAHYTFPGGRGEAYLYRHVKGQLAVQRSEAADAQWFTLDDLPGRLMPGTREVLTELLGKHPGPFMDELDVTPDRLALEREAARRFEAWLKPWVLAIAAAKGFVLQKALPRDPRPPRPRGIRNAEDEAMRRVTNLYADMGRELGPEGVALHRYQGTDEEGEQLSASTLLRSVKLGRAEAAKAILADAKGGKLPFGRVKGYRDKTIAKLQSLARRNVRLVRATTERKLAALALDAEAADVATLLQKLYDHVRAAAIATNLVSMGYVRGVLDVLHEYGYRYVYARTMSDERVCRECMRHEGRRYTILRFLAAYPRHPRCFTAGHMIATKDGDRPIEEVREGDLVLTHLGRYRPVVRTRREHVHEKGYRITTTSGKVLTVTAEHPFLTQRGWVAARDLRADDLLLEREGEGGTSHGG